MDHIIHFLNTSPVVATARFADQDIIAEAFKGRWRPLPWWANALKPARAVHTNIWEDQEVRLIHYMYVRVYGTTSSGGLPDVLALTNLGASRRRLSLGQYLL